jgi:hypothetical protein
MEKFLQLEGYWFITHNSAARIFNSLAELAMMPITGRAAAAGIMRRESMMARTPYPGTTWNSCGPAIYILLRISYPDIHLWQLCVVGNRRPM